MLRITALILAAVSIPAIVAPAAAQVSGVAVANPEGAIANSRAWAAARTQIETTYKTQLDQANARRDAVQKELTPLITAFNTARSQPNANQASLQSQAQAIQTRQQAAEQELGRLTLPAQRAQAYAIEQVSAKLNDAVQAVIRSRNISVLLRPDATLFAQPAADVTPAITTELDRLVPTVSITPPAGWEPGQAGQQGAAGAPAAATPAAPAANTNRRPAQPSGR
ncbi:hypothetical protein GCM10011380_21740 [Sphingomonas metalli]|uniref:OmpH family outer membrane protein n=1 Tax=Sphingomonas metalli TaxID=1779358 RepID=A0A916T4L9_9SPHN|nr:OmpH family outer membrane protein [Sphingomonas metalli]GGB31978.1 hypothetical protein GCM10011380_21740 [Sphingomonas metalli]